MVYSYNMESGRGPGKGGGGGGEGKVFVAFVRIFADLKINSCTCY